VRRPGKATLLAVAPLSLLLLYGVSRVAAPFGLLGVVFDHPWDYAIAAAAFAVASLVLMTIRPVDRRVGKLLAGAREPTEEERARLAPLLAEVAERAGLARTRFHLLVQDDDGLNAAAGGGHLLFVTRGALQLPDDALAAVLAHELGHHRELLPYMTALIWWAQLPALPLRIMMRALQHAVLVAGARLPGVLRVLVVPLQLVVLVIQVNLLWLVYLADLLVAWVSRIGERGADRHAAEWGFAAPLAGALATMSHGETGPQTRLDRLRADYPPVSERVNRLLAASSAAGDPAALPVR
jgi:Zn-dependent protease with chaperone function